MRTSGVCVATHQRLVARGRHADRGCSRDRGVARFPRSRLVDARQTLERLTDGIGDTLDEMGGGLQEQWTEAQTTEWRRGADVNRDRLVTQAAEALGDSHDAARWNHRDRRHRAELAQLEALLPRAERAAIGVSAIARTLDEFAQESPERAPADAQMKRVPRVGGAVRAVMRAGIDEQYQDDVSTALGNVNEMREACSLGAIRRAQLTLEHEGSRDRAGDEWLGYAAVLVHVDRVMRDLTGPLPT